MANPKELRIATSTFDGNRDKSVNWLFQTGSYILVNESVYDTDQKRIIFALSLMTEKAAARWAEVFYTKCFSAIQQVPAIPAVGTTPAVPATTTNNPDFGTWQDFEREFRKAFSPVDSQAGAMLKLTSWRQRKGTPVSDHI